MSVGPDRYDRGLTEADERLLALVRQGTVDAEIAVRMGLSTGEVRQRIDRLAAQLGVEGKAGLREWTGASVAGELPAVHRFTRRVWRAAAAGIAALALLAVGILLGRATAPGNAVIASQPTTAATQVVTALPPTVERPKTALINGISSVDVGQLITVGGHPLDGVKTTAQKHALAVVELAGAGAVHFSGASLQRVVNGGSVYGQAETRSGAVALYVVPADTNTRFIATTDGEAVYSTGDGGPSLLVWATGTRGAAASTQGLLPYYTSVDDDGELWVSQDPIAPGNVIDKNTGEKLDISSAKALGGIDSRSLETICEPAGLCTIAVEGALFPTPATGQVRCDSNSKLEFVSYASGVTLSFEGFNGSTAPACPQAPREVLANEPLIGGYYVVHAVDAAGRPISVAISGNGLIYAGEFGPKGGCPCFPRT
jgi:DNA-binding CsgD family transcriptional regulator